MIRVVASYFLGRKTAIRTAIRMPTSKHLKRKSLCLAMTIRISSIRNSEGCWPENLGGSSTANPPPVCCLLSTGYLFKMIQHGYQEDKYPARERQAQSKPFCR